MGRDATHCDKVVFEGAENGAMDCRRDQKNARVLRDVRAHKLELQAVILAN